MMQRQMRQSQTLVPFGVGAILDLQGESFVACDIIRWGARGTVVASKRLQRALGVPNGFRTAPIATSRGFNSPAAGVPFARFPRQLFCQHCRAMVRWLPSMEQPGKQPVCPHCDKSRVLVPMRWVAICEAGHLDDVDWRRWAHSRRRGDASQGRCEREDLSFETVSGYGAGGLDTLRVRCRVCNSSRSLQGLTSSDGLKAAGITCNGRQPWQRWEHRIECHETAHAVQRGAGNVYYPTVHSSIEVPDPSRPDADSELGLKVRNSVWFQAMISTNEDSPGFPFAVGEIAKLTGAPEDLIRDLARDAKADLAGHGTSVKASAGDLVGEEWAVFHAGGAIQADSFITRPVELTETDAGPAAQSLDNVIGQVVLADRLREVRALSGFHRSKPDVPKKLVPVDLGLGAGWLPAVETLGEGIFISLNEARLKVWEETNPDVQARAAALDDRITRSFMASRLRERTGPRLLPRYLLLHTFAHLLMRRLAFESGYSAASLRERIYAKDVPPDAAPQSGILIYTAAGDAEGTLGGLVRQGEPPRLARTVLEALAGATWCSADPLCGESRATGFGSLNLAACHACSLVSETSCESGNFLLDRACVVGGWGTVGFFEEVVREVVDAAAEVLVRE